MYIPEGLFWIECLHIHTSFTRTLSLAYNALMELNILIRFAAFVCVAHTYTFGLFNGAERCIFKSENEGAEPPSNVGGDPSAASATDTLLRLLPPREPYLR